MKLKYLVLLSLVPVFCFGQEVIGIKHIKKDFDITLREGTLNIFPLADNTVRIRFYKGTKEKIPEFVFSPNTSSPDFKIFNSQSKIKLKGKRINIEVDKQTGDIHFEDKSGKIFLREKTGTRKLIPDSVMGEHCFRAEQSFESPGNEYIYGLGQFQDGHYNLRNVTRRLTQVNSQISIPFIYSNKGYGLLWHQYGLTDFNPADNFIILEKREQSVTNNNQLAEVTTTAGTQKVSQNQTLYTGKFTVPTDGTYSVFLDLGDMDNRQFLIIDGKILIDISNFWLPPTVSSLVNLKAGEHQVQLVCKSGNTPKLSWKLTGAETTFRSPNAKLLDYIVIYGPSADSVIASYRRLTGNVPLLPLWAYGFWQCRERYTSGAQLVETVKEFRRRNLPMDVIVQDWQYWGNNGWGVPKFDTTNYFNPAGFIKELHDLGAHFNISIWSNPDRNSEIGKEYIARNLYIPNSKWLDYFNPVTRDTYWNTLNENLFSYGVDSWWMDATEPENDGLKSIKTYLGLGDFYRLTYPLFVSQAVYEGQRKATSEKRVCILTRSAFVGQQKYGTINWSGDIGGTWDSFRRQIVAGLNYSITGMPYWTTDIGGFFRPGESQYSDPKYHELLTRWFQWGTLNPIFRVHGYQSETEPWKYGQKVEDNLREMLNLRYRLLPYIYSVAWQIAHNGSTIMRPLIMDFSGDSLALNKPFEYMFGEALLIAPVTEPNVKEWNIYLPNDVKWYDFWTGEKFSGGQAVNKAVSIDIMPLYVKAGSIIPMGPKVQYSTEIKWDNLEIRVYEGADGEFTLYEDENDNYNYEKGKYSLITFNWNDKEKVLKISDRKGDFAGMLKKRKFTIVLVDSQKGIGVEVSEKPDYICDYIGKKAVIDLSNIK